MIRPYADRDLDGLLDVWYRASLLAHPFLSADFLEAERGRIAEQWVPMSDTSIYEIDGRVAGFLSLVGNEVGAIFVDPDLHGRGIGRALMDGARDAHPVLELDVFEANAIGRRFYDAYGFRFVDRHENDVAGHPELRLRLGATALRISELCINCADPDIMAAFWSAAIGYRETERDETGVVLTGAPTAPVVRLAATDDESGPSKAGPNRLHLDLSPTEAGQDAEVTRLEALGARRINIGQGTPSWIVMADPEGNEFCVLRNRVPPDPEPFRSP